MKQQRWILVVAALTMGTSLSCAAILGTSPRPAPAVRKVPALQGLELRRRVHAITDAIPMCRLIVQIAECNYQVVGAFPEAFYRTFVRDSGVARVSVAAYRYQCARALVRALKTAERLHGLPKGTVRVQAVRAGIVQCAKLGFGMLDEATAVARGPVPPDLRGTPGQPGRVRSSDVGVGHPVDGRADSGPPSPPGDSSGPPSPPASLSDDACSRGQVSVAGHCCWPGQDWGAGSQRCIGTPRCPSGTRTKGDTCVAGCPSGQVRVVGHCCWPGQDWGAGSQSCVGSPRCPRGTRRSGDTCVRRR